MTAARSAQLVRAAIGYAGFDLEELERRTGIKSATLRNYTSRSRPVRAPLEKRLLIGGECEVPRWFMETGFPPTAGSTEEAEEAVAPLLERMAALEEAVAQIDDGRLALLREFAALSDEVRSTGNETSARSATESQIQRSRRTKQLLAGPAAGDAPSTQADSGTRDEAESREEEGPAHGAGTRRSAGRPGR